MEHATIKSMFKCPMSESLSQNAETSAFGFYNFSGDCLRLDLQGAGNFKRLILNVHFTIIPSYPIQTYDVTTVLKLDPGLAE